MAGPKTNEREGTRATLRGYHMSATKARVVLDLIRGRDVGTAQEILAGTSREAARVISKVLSSAVANAVNNDGQSADELYVAAAFADEGFTMKRFTPRARGRAGRIRKRSCHITVIVARLDDERLTRLRAARNAQAAASRARRVASSRKRGSRRAEAAEAAEAEAVGVESTPVEALDAEPVGADDEAGEDAEGAASADADEETGE